MAWKFYTDAGLLKVNKAGTDAVKKALFDAHSILAATTDNTPAAVTVAEQTVVGRITGGDVAALTVTQVRTLLGSIDYLVCQVFS